MAGWEISLKQLIAIVLLSGVGGAATGAGDWALALAGLLGAGFAAVGFIRPALFFALFLVVRPLFDDLSEVSAGLPSAGLTGTLGVLLIAVAVAALVVNRKRVWPQGAGPLTGVVLASAVAAVVAILNFPGALTSHAGGEIVRLMALLAAYLLAATYYGTPQGVQKVFVLVGLSGVVPALYGIQQLIVGVPQKDNGDPGRITGTFVGPNALGAYCALAALILMFLPANVLPRLLRWVSVAALLVALYGTYSRVGWVLILLGVGILGWRRRPQLVVAMALGSVVLAIAVPSVAQRALPFGSSSGDSSSSSSSSGGTGYESFDWRIQNWLGLLRTWEARPLLGTGLQTTTWVNQRQPTRTQGQPGGGYEAHNMVVRMLVEGGVVLLVAYALFLGGVVRMLYRMTRRRWELAWAARVLLVLWSLVIFAGFTTADPLSLSAMMFGLLAMTGAVVGAYRSWAATARAHDPSSEPAAPAPARRAATVPAPSS